MAWRVKEEPSMASNPEQDFVLKTIKSRDVHFVRFWFTDVLGSMKSFAVIPSELEDAFADGMGFDGSCIEGFCRTEESDMLAFPDASTFQVLPWRPESNAVARMFCDIRTPDGKPFEGDPRHVLARVVGKAQDMGYVFNVGPEVEFYYFKDAEGTELLTVRRLLRPHEPRLRLGPAPRHGAHAGEDGHPRGVQPSRERPLPARDRPSLHRRPVHGRRGHDL